MDDWLLIHADTDRYLELGSDAAAVGAQIERVLRDGDTTELEVLLDVLSDRGKLRDPAAVDRLLGAYGGSRIAHGHTPIAFALGVDPAGVTEPLRSADDRVWNLDHCLFAGGPGFVTRLDAPS